MSSKAVSAPNTKVMGPRTRVTLDVAEVGLEQLVAGQPAHTVWLEPTDDEAYVLHVAARMGDARKRGEKPIADFLVECMNELIAAIDENSGAVPQAVLDTVERVMEKYEARNRKGPA